MIGCLLLAHSFNAQSWLPQGMGLLPFGYEVSSISVVHDSVVWVTASLKNGIFHPVKIFRSVDAGVHWQTIDLRICENCRAREIEAIDENTAWLSADGHVGMGILYKTIDGGHTWTDIITMAAAGQSIELYDDQHIACRNRYRFAWTEDGGQQWMTGMLTEIPSGFFPLSNTSNVHGDTAWFGMEGDQWYSYQTQNAKLIRTTRYGSEFSLLDTGLDSVAAIDFVSFSDAQHGIMKYVKWVPTLDWDLFPAFTWSEKHHLAKTINGGLTWSTIHAPFNTIETISNVPDAVGNFFVGVNNEIFHTTDSAKSWTLSRLEEAHCCLDFSSKNAGWVGIKSGNGQTPLVYKWDGEWLTGENKISRKQKLNISVFPNPTSAFIRYSMEGGEIGMHRVILTDAASQTVLDHYTNSQELDMGHLPAGIYYLRLSTASATSTTKVIKY